MRYFISLQLSLLLLSFSHLSLAELELEKLLKDKWLEVKTENFTIITDAKEKKAKLLAQDLESFRYFLTSTLGNTQISTAPLTIIAISSPKNFKRLDLPEFWAGVFLGGKFGDIAVANIKSYSSSKKYKSWGNQVLMHEYVHFMVKSMGNAGFRPLWFQEGEAEYLASFRMEGGGKYVSLGDMDVIGNRLFAILNNSGHGFEKVDVEDLFKTTNINMGWRRDDKGKQKRKDQKNSGKFYARAMITYHYLKSEEALSVKLRKYLNLINMGKSVDEAFSKSFEITYQEMDDAIEKYVSGKYVRKIRIDVKKTGIQFPTVKAKIQELDSPSSFSYLFSAVLRFRSYSLAEKDNIIPLADKLAPEHVETQLAKIRYLSTSDFFNIEDTNFFNIDKNKKPVNFADLKRTAKRPTLKEVNAQLDTLLEKHPDNANIYATQAYINLDPTIRQLQVGHPRATRNLAKLRNLARKSLRIDPNNGLAFYVLGVATTDSDEQREKFLAEAAMALDSSKLLLGRSALIDQLWNEIEVNILLDRPDAVLALSRQFRTVKSHDWVTKLYGLFFIEAQETRAVPFGKITRVDKSQIEYEDGSVYTGEIKNALPHGKGELKTYFGADMAGTWSAGYLEGDGDFMASNKYFYSGNFKQGLVSGKGVVIYPEGNMFKRSEGEFLMGMEHGEHTFEYSDGRIFSGSSYMGSFHGETTLKKEGNDPHKFNAFLGSKRQQINESLIFSGGWNQEFNAHGWGSCYDQQTNQVWRCNFKDGKLNPWTPEITSYPR